MDIQDTTYKQILRYVGFHQNSQSSVVNSIHGILSSHNILPEIVNVLTVLKRDYSVLFYSGKATDARRFTAKLADDLRNEKVVIIAADTLDFDPVIYDQLIRYRDENKFTVTVGEGQIERFPPKSKIFLCYNAKPHDTKIYEISNHVLNLGETTV
jgi:hypothetical protein